MNENIKIPIGPYVKILSNQMKNDPDYAYAWHANVAMASVDEGMAPEAANKAASRFMKIAFDVETSQDMLLVKYGPH